MADIARILCVDDNDFVLRLTKSLLLKGGYQTVETAKDGTEALDLMVDFDPDVVLIDWQMEPMDGITFIREVRQSQTLPNPVVPIVLMTAHPSREVALEAKEAGANGLVAKPITSKPLLEKIDEVTRMSLE